MARNSLVSIIAEFIAERFEQKGQRETARPSEHCRARRAQPAIRMRLSSLDLVDRGATKMEI